MSLFLSRLCRRQHQFPMSGQNFSQRVSSLLYHRFVFVNIILKGACWSVFLTVTVKSIGLMGVIIWTIQPELDKVVSHLITGALCVTGMVWLMSLSSLSPWQWPESTLVLRTRHFNLFAISTSLQYHVMRASF